MCAVQALEYDGCVAARLLAMRGEDAIEAGRFPADVTMSAPSIGQHAPDGAAGEPFVAADGVICAPLHSLGVTPMILELYGVRGENLAFVGEVANVLAARAGFLALSEPHYRMLPALRGSEEVDRAISGFSTALQPLIQHDRLSVYLLTAGDRAIERFAVAGARPLPEEELVIPISEFGFQECLRQDRAQLIGNIPQFGGESSRVMRLMSRAGFYSLLNLPLRDSGQRIGLLQLLSRTADYYLPGDIAVAQQIADQAAPFIEHLRRHEAVRPAALREAVETERTRLVRDLDPLLRSLLPQTSANIETLMRSDTTSDDMRTVGGRAVTLIEEARDIVLTAVCNTTPAPLRSRPLGDALDQILRRHASQLRIAATLSVRGNLDLVSMTARRMLCGVLTAAVRTAWEADATKVTVLLTVDEDVLLNVTDNGNPGQRHTQLDIAAPDELQSLDESARSLGGRLFTTISPSDRTSTTLVLELPRTQPARRDLEDERWLAAVPRREHSLTVRIYVLDGHGVRRAGLTHFFEAQQELRVIGQAASIDEALPSIKWLQPDVIFIDAEENAAEATPRLLAVAPAAVVIGLATKPEPGIADSLHTIGVAAVLPRHLERDELLDVIAPLVRGEALPHGNTIGHTASLDAELSSREQSVLALVVEGYTNAEIGTQLFLAPKTIERYVSSLVRRTGARNRAHLAGLAIGRGLIHAPTLELEPLPSGMTNNPP
jgi:DNA-binding NarL/FixJ family response regulator